MKKYAFVGGNVAQYEFCKTIKYQAREKLQSQIKTIFSCKNGVYYESTRAIQPHSDTYPYTIA
jgi:hypothetical protein